jgi:thiol-disulfide isomerase/thioredoxin
MRAIVIGLLLCIPSNSAHASDPRAPKEQYKALLKEFDAAVAAWDKAVDQAKEGSEPKWPGLEFVARFLKFAEANPTDPAATDALLWVVNKALNIQVGGREFYPHYRHALELLARGGHLDDKRLGRTCMQGLQYASAASESFLRVLIDQSHDREVRARASLALTKILNDKVLIAAHSRFDPNSKSPSDRESLGRLDLLYIGYIRGVDPKTSKDQAERLLDQCIKDYGDIVYSRARKPGEPGVTIADAAKLTLHELRELSIGKVAPEIVGDDIDGRLMKLSDHKGKVIVLVFWATWCGPCMDLVPHERALVERLKGKPFVLLGIDGDLDRERAKQAVKRERITWRSWWNRGPTGPITEQYNVEGWPTVYVLDGKGVIRHRQLVGEKLDEAVDALLKEMESGSS